jgi:hypothetical protein
MRTAIYVLILTTDRMKTLSKLLVIIIGFTTIATMAQKVDSVIVIYNNQKTIVPLPAFGSQTSVSYADTNKVVEIGVWLRKPGETSPFSQLYFNDVTSGKSKSKSKWFSEIEAGYIKGYKSSYRRENISTNSIDGASPTILTETYWRSGNKGYQIRLSIQESEYYLNKKSSIISGFKLGFSQSNLQAYSYGNVSDSAGNVLRSFDDNYKFRINSFQFLYQFGYSYHFSAGKLPAKLNFGNSMGIVISSTRTNNQVSNGGLLYVSLLQPYLGVEIWKMGLLFSADFALPTNHYFIMRDHLGGNINIALTYRIF